MQAVVGQDVTADLVAPPETVLQGWRLGARIEVPVTRAVVSYWTPAVLSDEGDSWSVTLDAPPAPGDYNLVWRTDDPSEDVNTPENSALVDMLPVYETFVPLFTLASDAADDMAQDFPPVDIARITPTAEDVARLERTRTVDAGGNDLGTFTATTRPTIEECENLIQHAIYDVLLELPDELPVDYYDSIKRMVEFYTAVLIEVSYYREEVAQNTPAMQYQDRYQRGMAALNARIQTDVTRGFIVARDATWTALA